MLGAVVVVGVSGLIANLATIAYAAGPASAQVELRRAIVALGAPSEECPTQCSYDCFSSGDHKNSTHASGTNKGTTHGCEFTEDGCRDHTCQIEFAQANVDLGKLESVIRSVGGDDLVSMERLNGRLVINRERGAVQVLACRSQVALSVQLSDQQRAELGLTR